MAEILLPTPPENTVISSSSAVSFDVRDAAAVGEIVVVARFPGFPFAELVYIGDPAASSAFENLYSEQSTIAPVADPGFQRFRISVDRSPVWPDSPKISIYSGGGGGPVTIEVEESGTPKGPADTLNFVGATVVVAGLTATISGLQGPAGATGNTGPAGPTGTVNLSHAPYLPLVIAANAITIDLALGGLFDLTLTSDVTTVTMANPDLTANEANFFSLRIRQDGTGGRVFTPPASWKFATGAYIASSAANAVDRLQGISHDNGATYDVSYLRNFL
jgi:hypothetical protein